MSTSGAIARTVNLLRSVRQHGPLPFAVDCTLAAIFPRLQLTENQEAGSRPAENLGSNHIRNIPDLPNLTFNKGTHLATTRRSRTQTGWVFPSCKSLWRANWEPVRVIAVRNSAGPWVFANPISCLSLRTAQSSSDFLEPQGRFHMACGHVPSEVSLNLESIRISGYVLQQHGIRDALIEGRWKSGRTILPSGFLRMASLPT